MKLFFRIFLSFWFATLLMIGFVLWVSKVFPVTFPGDRETRFDPQIAKPSLTRIVEAYERESQAGLSSDFRKLAETRRRRLYLFDQYGRVLVEPGPLPPSYEPLAKDVLQSGHSELRRLAARTLFACPIQSQSGRRYAVILTVFEPMNRLFRTHFWFNLTIAMVPAALVCLVLSLYLTRPISRLRATAQRLARGELNARAMADGARRGDELGDLARDFDVMAGQIQSLMTAQRRFVADVSHELGAPLTRMHLALALMRRQSAQKDSPALERIERETGKLSSLVQQLLLLARMEAGSLPAETMAPISVRALCEGIIEDANFEAAHASCEVVGSRQEVTLPAYPQLLRRALDNVLRNAIRHTPPWTQIIFNCRVDSGLQQVIFEIMDSGPGVPESMLTDIFRPFFRTSPGRETQTGGTGLGLAIASEAIRLHNGTIAADNRETGGLSVTIRLPLRFPTSEGEVESTITAAEMTTDQTGLGALTSP